MEKISQVGKQLREKRKQTEEQLQTEFKESLQRLEQSLTELSNNKLTQIESDINEKIEEIREFGETKIQRLVNANHKLYKETITAEKEEWTEELKKWRMFLLILLPTALIFGLIAGALVTRQFFPPQQSLSVSESEIAESKDGARWIKIDKIPNLQIIKDK